MMRLLRLLLHCITKLCLVQKHEHHLEKPKEYLVVVRDFLKRADIK